MSLRSKWVDFGFFWEGWRKEREERRAGVPGFRLKITFSRPSLVSPCSLVFFPVLWTLLDDQPPFFFRARSLSVREVRRADFDSLQF